MKNRFRLWNALLVIFILGGLIQLSGCGKDPRSAVGRMDTPEHHTLRGHDFIDEGRWDDADREFDLALSLQKKFSPALAGKGIVMAWRSNQVGVTNSQRRTMAKKSKDLVEDALSEAKTPDHEREAHTAGIRVNRLSKFPADWIKPAEKHYILATRLDKRGEDPLPFFYMARAWRDSFKLRKATDLYRRVLEINKSKTREADQEYALVQKVQRSQPGSRHAKVIAFEPSITRADVAALFIAELSLKALYSRGNRERANTGFKAATKERTFNSSRTVKADEATDIRNHPMRSDIEEVMRLGVLGLEPDPAHLFHPNAKTTRAEFAIMVEDILVNVTGETKLKTKFVGAPSPFPDVRNDLPYFNAVQTVVSRNLMEPKNKIRGLFAPTDPVSGADSLLVIRQMKNELKSYLR